MSIRTNRLDAYLSEKIAAHVAAILDQYIANPDDIGFATDEVMEAIEQEITWAVTDDTKPIPNK